MENDFTLLALTVAVIIFSVFVFRSVASDHKKGIRRY